MSRPCPTLQLLATEPAAFVGRLDMGTDMSHCGNDDDVTAERAKPKGGIYSLPVVGNAAVAVRQFYDDVAPSDTDRTEQRVAKEVLRWSSAVAGAAAVAVMVL